MSPFMISDVRPCKQAVLFRFCFLGLHMHGVAATLHPHRGTCICLLFSERSLLRVFVSSITDTAAHTPLGNHSIFHYYAVSCMNLSFSSWICRCHEDRFFLVTLHHLEKSHVFAPADTEMQCKEDLHKSPRTCTIVRHE